MGSNPSRIVARPEEDQGNRSLDEFEAGFDQPRSVAPSVSSPDAAAWLTRALAYRVRREPGNLLAHVQRINLLCRNAAGSNRIFNAASELFEKLAGRGAALRQRMTAEVSPWLDLEMGRRLEVVGAASVPAPMQSPCIVAPTNHGTDATSDPVACADELLTLGDYAEAQSILEAALEHDPVNPDIAKLLQSIYRSARDVEAYARVRLMVLAKAPAAAIAWPENLPI